MLASARRFAWAGGWLIGSISSMVLANDCMGNSSIGSKMLHACQWPRQRRAWAMSRVIPLVQFPSRLGFDPEFGSIAADQSLANSG
jgi:hypothetical protein